MKYDCKLYKIEYNENRISTKLLLEFVNQYDVRLNNVINKLNVTSKKINIHIMSKEELDKYVAKNSISYLNLPVPSWLVGFSSSEVVCITEMDKSNLDEWVALAVHESIHYMLYNINKSNKRLKLLDEGIATYFSSKVSKNSTNVIINDYLNNSLKNLSEFCIYDIAEFNKIHGYSYCFFITQFLEETFGIDKVLYWFKNQTVFLSDVQCLNLDKMFNDYIVLKIKEKIKHKP